MKRLLLIILYSLFTVNYSLLAGPPFNTDDPEPVDFRHWECYFASINIFTQGFSTGTLPHLDINYGILPNVQLTFTLPMNYNDFHNSEANNQNIFQYGYANTEIGVKYRFINLDENTFQIAVFPSVEIPTVNNADFTNGKMQVHIPIWMQKSWNQFTTFGGAGYWINPGTGNKNWLFAGWEAQYDISKTFTPGCELIYETASTTSPDAPYPASISGYKPFFGINAGGFVNFNEHLHFIFTVGHSLSGQSTTIAYVGLLLTV